MRKNKLRMPRLRIIPKPSNPFLISSIIVGIYSTINPKLFSLNSDRVSFDQIFNAINWALNNSWPYVTGLTSWTTMGDAEDGIYLVEIISYLPAILAKLIFDMNTVLHVQRIIDISIIIGGISLFSELITTEVIKIQNECSKIVFKCLIISIFIFSPWAAYLIYKSTWHEPLFMLAIISAMMALCRNKITLGTILMIISSLIHHQYAFFISLYFITSFISTKLITEGNHTSWKLPKIVDLKIVKNYQKLMWSGFGLIMLPLYQARKYISAALIGLSPNNISGSSLLNRTGLDGNIHSGGLLGSLQFLGGYKWYYCFLINNADNTNISEFSKSKISAIVNCELVLLSTVLLCLISIYGLYILYVVKDKYMAINNLWVPNVITFLFLGMLLIFQQSFTVHIIGYSYVWAFIFTLGFSIFIYRLFLTRNLSQKILGLVFYTGCATSLIQASFKVSEIRSLVSYF